MNDQFDAYHTWLGIPPSEQPPNRYRLLGIPVFESNADVIENAADRQMNYLRAASTGKRAARAQDLLNEVSATRVCLLNANSKAAYDAKLRAAQVAKAPPSNPPAVVQPQPPLQTQEMMTTPASFIAATHPAARRNRNRRDNSANRVALMIGGGVAGIILGAIFLAVVFQSDPFTAAPQPTPINDAVARRTAKPVIVKKPRPKSEPIPPARPAPKVKPLPNQPSPADATGYIPARTPTPMPDKTTDVVPKPATENEPPPPKFVDELLKNEEVETRAALPHEDEQRASLDDLRKILPNEYLNATTSEGQRALVDSLRVKFAGLRDDPTGTYVILQETYRLAKELKDLSLAEDTIERVVAQYAVDTLHVRTQLVDAAVPWANDPIKKQAVAATAASLLALAMHQNRFDEAERLITLLRPLADELRDADLSAGIEKQQETLQRRKPQFESARDAATKLDSNPDDPAANLAFGTYLCVFKQDWDAGLALLAKGSDAKLRDLAEAGAKPALTPDEQLQLADRWYELAQSNPALAGFFVQARDWYERAARGLTGLAQLKVAKQIETLVEQIPNTTPPEYIPLMEGFQAASASTDELIAAAYRQVLEKQDGAACRTLERAAKLDPENLRPIFEVALIMVAVRGEEANAKSRFERCSKDSNLAPAALNNLALCEIKLGKVSEAIRHLTELLSLQSPPNEAVQNVYRLIALSEAGKVAVPASRKAELDQLRQRADELSKSHGVSSQGGWLYVSLDRNYQTLTGLSLEDRRCLVCKGAGTRDCTNRSCKNGTVSVTRTEMISLPDGSQLPRQRSEKQRCSTCSGSGTAPCPFCVNGSER